METLKPLEPAVDRSPESAVDILELDKKVYEDVYSKATGRILCDTLVTQVVTPLVQARFPDSLILKELLAYIPGKDLSCVTEAGSKRCVFVPVNGSMFKISGDAGSLDAGGNGLEDLAKNISYAKAIREFGELGKYYAVRDWAKNERPFYVVMTNAKHGNLLFNLCNPNTAASTKEALVDFLEKFTSEKMEVPGQAMSYIKVVLTMIEDYTMHDLKIDDANDRQGKLRKIEDRFKEYLPEKYRVVFAIPDPTDNILFTKPMETWQKEQGNPVILIDQGLRNDLTARQTWPTKFGPYLAPLPLILGQLYYSLKLFGEVHGSKISPTVLRSLEDTFMGPFGNNGQYGEYSLRRNIFDLGGLVASTVFEFGHPGAENAKNQTQSLLTNLIG